MSPGQALTAFQRSLTTMQIQVAGLLQFAVPLFPTAEVRRLPPTASVLEEGEPQLDPDHPPHPTPPLPSSRAPQSQAVESAPWPLCTRCCLGLCPQARPHRSLSAYRPLCVFASSCFRKTCSGSSSC